MDLSRALRRVVGTGLTNCWYARTEVLATLADTELRDATPTSDALDLANIPSVARLGSADRVLAEIDQDGFAFAIAAEDATLFNRREVRHPRQQHQLQIVLHGGRVCVRKQFRRPRLGARLHGGRRAPLKRWVVRCFWVTVKLLFYTEVAALLRLRNVASVPKLRHADSATQTLVVDYVSGPTLRDLAARQGSPVYDLDLQRDGSRSVQFNEAEMERRERGLIDALLSDDLREQIAGMAREVAEAGVAPLDIKPGNFLRGATTGRLHWIDFEMSRLASQPDWPANLTLSTRLINDVFDLKQAH